jgi:hypothetical protein
MILVPCQSKRGCGSSANIIFWERRLTGQCAHPDNGTRIAGSGRIVAYPDITPF